MSLRPLLTWDLGRRPYHPVLELQRELCRRRMAGELGEDLLLLVEHEPVITLGRGTRSESLPLGPTELERRGIPVVEVERGGDVTYHGPGQLVGYPILDLREHRPDLHWYLRGLEEALISGLAELGIQAERRHGLTGVWVGTRKIASIGIHVKQWVTFHGFALNVTTDLSCFDLIVPCGIHGVEMTHVAREVSDSDPGALWERTRAAIIRGFARVFQRKPVADGAMAHLPIAFPEPPGFSVYHGRVDPTPFPPGAGGPADQGDTPGRRQLGQRSAAGADAGHPRGVHPAGRDGGGSAALPGAVAGAPGE